MLEKVRTRFWDVARCTYGQLLDEMERWRVDGSEHMVCFCDGNGLPHAYWGDEELRAAYAKADAVCADGVATEKLAAIWGGPLPERVIGPKLFPKAMEYGVSRGWRHYFYGGAKGIPERLAEVVRRDYPGIQVVGVFSPPKRELDSPEWADDIVRIRAAKPDFLWVALGCPKQEKWCARHLQELGVPVVLPVGAVFDFFTGNVPITPEWVHRIGCCWLWRLVTGGRRVFWRNVKCVMSSVGVLVVERMRRLFWN